MDVKKMVKIILIGLIIFIIIFGILIYGIRQDYIRGESVLEYKDKGPEYVDRAHIVEGSEEALNVRLNMLDSAEEKVDIAYYKIDTGDTAKIFLGKVLETAERGVKVRIYLDGILNNLTGNVKNANYAFANHPNIEYRLHQPLEILKPWTYNNRLHDKIIIVDDNLGIIGGRNIGDRFFVTDTEDRKSVFDRDILVYNEEGSDDSVIKQMRNYYDELWYSDVSKNKFEKISDSKKEKGQEFLTELIDDLRVILKENPDYFTNIDWKEETEPIKRVEFVHNSLNSDDDPVGLIGILEILEMAKDEIIVQSPYIIVSRNMWNVMNKYDIDYGKMKILTNSYYSTPNIMAISGYHNMRKDIVDKTNEVYEYQAGNSIHGKSYIVDDEISIIGSFNLDPRSAYLSTEAYLVVYDENLSGRLKNNMEDLVDNSFKVGKDYEYQESMEEHRDFSYKLKVFLIKILSKITYFFDFLL